MPIEYFLLNIFKNFMCAHINYNGRCYANSLLN